MGAWGLDVDAPDPSTQTGLILWARDSDSANSLFLSSQELPAPSGDQAVFCTPRLQFRRGRPEGLKTPGV